MFRRRGRRSKVVTGRSKRTESKEVKHSVCRAIYQLRCSHISFYLLMIFVALSFEYGANEEFGGGIDLGQYDSTTIPRLW